MSSGTVALEPAEIVTGERLAALAERTLLPRAIASRLGTAAPAGPATVRFQEHRTIDDEQLRVLSASRSLFVYTHALSLFQEHIWPRLDGPGYVLITHNSDHEIGPGQLSWVEAAGDKLAHWFTQNLLVQHPKLTPLPIGIANRAWAHGNVDALRTAMGSARPTELVHAAFDPSTHPDRARAWEAVGRALGVPVAASMPYEAYLADLARHRFSVCPRGNGIDTHRFWECQYLGVVPVVERSPHTEMWEQQGLPLLQLDDWSELSRDRLEAEPSPSGRDLKPVLLLSHFARLIHDAADGARGA